MKREKLDRHWHMARVAARIWLKAQQGEPLSPRDKRLARYFAEHRGVENRLIEQARTWWTAPFVLDENLRRQPRKHYVRLPADLPGDQLGDARWQNFAQAAR